jgi:Right handed beta helix region
VVHEFIMERDNAYLAFPGFAYHFYMKNSISAARELLFFLLMVCGLRAAAQVHGFEIAREQKMVDGLAMGIKPGDTIFIIAGDREEIRLENITGTVKKPVVIINRGGKVVINTRKDYGILFGNSIHFKVTGTGSHDAYGIEIASSANHGLVVTAFSSCCEADHLEIHHVGYAAIVAKTDPNCSGKDLRCFIMQHLSFHDNLIHDTNAEGFYVGYSWYPARDYTCGQDSLLYSHEIHGIRIYNNTIRNSGQEAIQVGTGTRDVMIYSNKVYNYGVTNTLWQNHGIQIGQGTTGDLFNNSISTGPAEAISLFGGGNNRVYNNIIINSGASAIYQNDRGAASGTNYHIINNTIINPQEYGITVVSEFTKDNVMSGNVIVIKNAGNAIVNSGHVKWDSSGNKIFSRIEEAGFNDSALADPKGKGAGAFAYGDGKAKVSRFPFAKDASIAILTDEVRAGNTYSFSVNLKEASIKLYSSGGILPGDKVSIKGRHYKIDLSGFASGIYYVAVLSGGKACQWRRVIFRKSN